LKDDEPEGEADDREAEEGDPFPEFMEETEEDEEADDPVIRSLLFFSENLNTVKMYPSGVILRTRFPSPTYSEPSGPLVMETGLKR
jgi:hypothetical protein